MCGSHVGSKRKINTTANQLLTFLQPAAGGRHCSGGAAASFQTRLHGRSGRSELSHGNTSTRSSAATPRPHPSATSTPSARVPFVTHCFSANTLGSSANRRQLLSRVKRIPVYRSKKTRGQIPAECSEILWNKVFKSLRGIINAAESH